MRRTVHLFGGLAAAIALALLVIGVPAGLVYWQGNLIPSTMPHVSALTSPLTMDSISKIVAALMWLAWAQFMVAVIAEVRYQWPRRHQARARAAMPIRRHLPGTGPSGALAGRLVALVLLLSAATGAVASSANAASAATASSAPTRPHAVASAPATVNAGTRTPAQQARADAASSTTQTDAQQSNAFGIPVGATYYTVRQYDSLSRIAEECLGDESRYGEIFNLNVGREQPDGLQLHDRSLIRPGWLLIMPAGAEHCQVATAAPASPAADSAASSSTYQVQPTNTLSQIAQDEYGNATDWPAIYAANQGKVLDGHQVTDPNQIYPGQTFVIPALPDQGSNTTAHATSSAPSSGTKPTAPANSTTDPGTTAAPSTGPGSASSSAGASATQTPSSSATSAATTSSPSTSTSTPSTPASSTATSTSTHTAPSSMAGERTLFELLGLGGLAGAAAVTALGLRRRRQQHARRPGEYIQMPGAGPNPTQVELLLRSGQDSEGAEWLDRVLRTLAATAITEGLVLPDLRLLSLGPDALYLQPAAATAPIAPFTAAGEWWMCPRTAPLASPQQLEDVPAPYPSLVTVGCDEHSRSILVDLESIRTLALPGTVGLGALRALTLELLGQTTADIVTVTLVGVGYELADADLPASINLAVDLDEAITSLGHWIRFASQQLEGSGFATVRDARLAQYEDAPVTHVLISAEPPTAEQAERLAGILRGAPAMCAAVVCNTPVPVDAPAWVLPATGAPELLEPTGIPVTAQYLTDPNYAELIEAFRVSGRMESTPIPAWTAPASEPQEAGEEGEQLAGFALDPEAAEEFETFEGFEAFEPEPSDDQADEQPALVERDPAAPPDPNDPPLSARGQGPQVLVLGSVELSGARGSVEVGREGVPLEMAAYMVLNPGRRTPELTEALWPGGTATENRNNVAHRLRAWLGVDDAGEPYFPPARRGYRLAHAVGCDLIQFNALYLRGKQLFEAGDSAAAAPVLEAALRLVRGRPFADAPHKRYGWADKIVQQTLAEISTAAEMLAAIRRDEGDWPGAAQAATLGMVTGIAEFESLFRIRFEAAYRVKDTDEMDRLATTLQARLEELGISMEDATRAMLNDLLERHPARGVGSANL